MPRDGGDDKGQHPSMNKDAKRERKSNSKTKPAVDKDNDTASTIAAVEKKEDAAPANAPEECQTAKLGKDDKGKVAEAESDEAENVPEKSRLSEQTKAEPLQEGASAASDTTTDECANFEASVGVVDGKQVVPAEAYLVKRLQGIAAKNGVKGSAKGAKKAPAVVWM